MHVNLDQNIPDFLRAHTVHVYGGTGAEGSAIITWLRSIDHEHIIAHDFSPTIDDLLIEWRRVHEGASDEDERQFKILCSDSNIRWQLGLDYATPPGEHDIFFVTQSWFRYGANDFLKVYFAATNRAVLPEYLDRVWTLTRLYFALFKGTLIAVTGSDGKTTTTRMIGSIMSVHAAEKNVVCIETGNDRAHAQSISAIAACGPRDFLVLEISDRQLSCGFQLTPDIAVVTNVTPNKHMDDYGGFDAYKNIKGNLLRFQSKQHHAILNADDETTVDALISIGAAARAWVSTVRAPEEGVWCDGKNFIRVRRGGLQQNLMSVADLSVVGKHNWYNAAEALLATEQAGVSPETATRALKTFAGVPHRLQQIRRWKRLIFVEDSSGGNPANIPVTIQTFSAQPLVLIVGGYRNNLMIDEIISIIHALDNHSSVVALLLIGQVAPRLKLLLDEYCENFRATHIVHDLPGAFAWITEHRESLTASQEVVVCMTPGFESFDQYKDYRARAEHFIQLVNDLSA